MSTERRSVIQSLAGFLEAFEDATPEERDEIRRQLAASRAPRPDTVGVTIEPMVYEQDANRDGIARAPLDLYRTPIRVDRQNGSSVREEWLKQGERQIACKLIATNAGRRPGVHVLDFAIMRPKSLKGQPDYSRIARNMSAPLANIRSALRPYGLAVERIERGTWRAVPIDSEEEAERRVLMYKAVRLAREAIRAMRNSSYDEAMSKAAQAVDIHPEFDEAHRVVCECFFVRKCTSEDVEVIRRSAKFFARRYRILKRGYPLPSRNHKL